ncbi:hypothetical protein ACIBBE_31800 [Streptomyces sp. NPDC051644]|uniref:hypothetical protein n=1 Tax=Streptomyces sp. NPDC051644 TaxID=3365666 RepID=UPI0037BDD89A
MSWHVTQHSPSVRTSMFGESTRYASGTRTSSPSCTDTTSHTGPSRRISHSSPHAQSEVQPQTLALRHCPSAPSYGIHPPVLCALVGNE